LEELRLGPIADNCYINISGTNPSQRMDFYVNNVLKARIDSTGLDGSYLATASVTALQLAANSVTSSEILNGEVTGVKLATDAVTDDKISNRQVTREKTANVAHDDDVDASGSTSSTSYTLGCDAGMIVPSTAVTSVFVPI